MRSYKTSNTIQTGQDVFIYLGVYMDTYIYICIYHCDISYLGMYISNIYDVYVHNHICYIYNN